MNTSIEWTNKTWNPIKARLKAPLELQTHKGLKVIPAGKVGYHCEKISPGCKRCYAKGGNCRCLPSWGTGLDYTVPNRDLVEIFLDEEVLLEPLKWRGTSMAFPCSMTDWMAGFVSDDFIYEMLSVIARTPWITYQALTKRADRLNYLMNSASLVRRVEEAGHARGSGVWKWEGLRFPLPNLWLGVSVENQEYADLRIPELLETPAAVRFVSAEPLLGPISFRWAKWQQHKRGNNNHLDGLRRLDWVIVGGESGRGARECNERWISSIVEECREARVPCFVKQLGSNAVDQLGKMRGAMYSGTDYKGSRLESLPRHLQVRQMPVVPRVEVAANA